MAPGDRSRKRKALPPGHSTSQTNSSSVNANSSNSSKKGRGPSTNAALDKATSGGRKVFLDIPDNKVKPVGQWASSFATEVGIICRTWANPSMEKWGDISTEDKDFMCKKILDKFDIDMSRPNVKLCLEEAFMSRYRDWRADLHKYYKDNLPHAKEKPPKNMAQDIWDRLCDRFSSEKFQNRSTTNAKNRSQLKVNHISGSKSFINRRHELRDPHTKVEPDRIEFYRLTHYSSDTKSWISSEAERLYNEMIALRAQHDSDSDNLMTTDEICEQVLGTKSGYIRGLGHGEKPDPSSKSGQNTRLQLEKALREVEETRRNAETDRQEAAETRQHLEQEVETNRREAAETRKHLEQEIETNRRKAEEDQQRFDVQEAKIQEMTMKQIEMETLLKTLVSHVQLPPKW